MSDIATQTTPEQPPATGATPTTPTVPTTPATGEPQAPGTPAPAAADQAPATSPANDVASMEAALRKANKEAETFRKRLKEIEDQGKSDLERLTEANKGLEATASDHAKLTAAMAKAPAGTTPEQILSLYKRLQGATVEELETDAEQLFAQFTGSPAAPQQQPNPGLPVEKLQPGAPQTGNGPTLQDQIQAAEAKGDWATARRLKSQMTIESMRSS